MNTIVLSHAHASPKTDDDAFNNLTIMGTIKRAHKIVLLKQTLFSDAESCMWRCILSSNPALTHTANSAGLIQLSLSEEKVKKLSLGQSLFKTNTLVPKGSILVT